MGIQTLEVRGFRSLRGVTWKPGSLNVLIGPNGSGKSNLLRAIALLQTSATGELSKEIVRLGGIAPLLWDGQAEEIGWSVTIDLPNGKSESAHGAMAYELRLRRLGVSSSYRVERERLGMSGAPEGGPAASPQPLLERGPGEGIVMILDRELEPIKLFGGFSEGEPALNTAGGPFGHPEIAGFRTALASWSIYHDVVVDQRAPLRQAAVARLETRVASDGQNLTPVLHTLYTGNRDFKKLVDESMRAAFGGDYEELVFPPAADQRVQLRVRWRSLRTEQSAADLSDGTVRFLLLLAILGNPDPGALIAIDEPEVGLHPGMLPVVAELAVDASRRTQVILTTHSPQFLDAFGGEPPTTTVARWEDGETRLATIDGDELRRWLVDYSLGALFRSGELEGMV